MKKNLVKSTTIIGIRKNNEVVIAGDGQASMGATILKSKVKKVRRLGKNQDVIAGFAGSTADAFALFERLESKLEKHTSQLQRACVELAKDWRMDRYLRKLEAMLIVADKEEALIISGTGDVLEPDFGIASIGSGSNYAQSAARALVKHAPNMSAEEIVREGLNIAADICVFTNHNLIIETVGE